MTEEEIREQITKTIQSEPNNLDKILSLTRQLALADKDNVRFSVDAGVIDRLGRELVARHETAVSELVKNAYDADASFAKLYFSNVNGVGGQLIIEDDGNGMDKEQLINGFMRISSSDKIHNPLSPIYNRKRAGKKGIGRFASQRLGNVLTIITQTENSEEALKITVNWDDYAMDKDLISVANKIETVPKEKPKGTILIIDNLREWWTDAMIKRVYRYAVDVIQAFPLAEVKNKEEEEIIDIGFAIECYKDQFPIATTQSMFYDHALAEIVGSVDKDGKAYWKIINSKLPAVINNKPQYFSKDDKEENIPFNYLKGVELRAYYFIYNIGMIPKQVENYIDSKKGGIKVYRNGFRVLPYGEEYNDWIELDESVRLRKYLFVHGNHNFFGFVEINGDNPNFIELSSREGFLNNDAYDELVTFVYKSLTSATRRIASERGIKQTTDQKDWEAKYDRTPKETVEDTVGILEEIAKGFEDESKKTDSDDKSSQEEKDRKKRENAERAKKAREQAEKLKNTIKHIEEINMLRVLAGLGIVIGEFTHEISQYLSSFEIDTNFLVEKLEEGTEEHLIALGLKKRFESFRIYASYFDETVSENVNRELHPIDLRLAINPFFDTLKKDLERNNISIKIEYKDVDLYTCKMHSSEWASILFNLYSNAKKAMKRNNTINKKLLIIVGRNENNVFVEFIDNGDGIPIENREKIFNAFFTTSSPKSNKSNVNQELTGTGLGLKIIKDIIESYKGEISVENPPVGYATNIRIDVPEPKTEEIPDDNF